MPVQFTTDIVPDYRRLALWQDIVCDVYVQLDCKSDLGRAFNGSVTRAPLGQAACAEVYRSSNVCPHPFPHRPLQRGLLSCIGEAGASVAWCRTAAKH